MRDDREVKNERPRKEAERVSIPTWPKIHQLDNWKMQLLMNVLSACADPDTDTWTRWLAQALGLNPDLNFLNDSGGDRFATIDIKMAMGMQNMLRQAPDQAKDVHLDATRHSELRHQQGVTVKGRELVALVMQSFRTPDRTDLVYHIEHLFNLDFPGDKNLVVFRNKWYDLLLKMRSEDRPSPLALRDILYRKIKGSKKMEFGLNAYHRLPDKHPQDSPSPPTFRQVSSGIPRSPTPSCSSRRLWAIWVSPLLTTTSRSSATPGGSLAKRRSSAENLSGSTPDE